MRPAGKRHPWLLFADPIRHEGHESSGLVVRAASAAHQELCIHPGVALPDLSSSAILFHLMSRRTPLISAS